MELQKIKEAVIRSEGYAEGFVAGYRSCANMVVTEMEKSQPVLVPEPPKE
jgi:hypothetical protein